MRICIFFLLFSFSCHAGMREHIPSDERGWLHEGGGESRKKPTAIIEPQDPKSLLKGGGEFRKTPTAVIEPQDPKARLIGQWYDPLIIPNRGKAFPDWMFTKEFNRGWYEKFSEMYKTFGFLFGSPYRWMLVNITSDVAQKYKQKSSETLLPLPKPESRPKDDSDKESPMGRAIRGDMGGDGVRKRPSGGSAKRSPGPWKSNAGTSNAMEFLRQAADAAIGK